MANSKLLGDTVSPTTVATPPMVEEQGEEAETSWDGQGGLRKKSWWFWAQLVAARGFSLCQMEWALAWQGHDTQPNMTAGALLCGPVRLRAPGWPDALTELSTFSTPAGD